MSGVGLNPTRTAWIDAFVRMGAAVSVQVDEERAQEPVGTLRVSASSLTATEISGSEIPNLIDEIPILAVAATQAEGTTVISDARELRVKESDRIATLAEGLRSVGADISEMPDGMIIHGPTPLGEGTTDPRGDHRAAMAFAVAGLVSHGEVHIPGWGCVDTSFPGFSAVLKRATGDDR
jgi:3-phosphoshikimate 1-carboxyvinyltransferase